MSHLDDLTAELSDVERQLREFGYDLADPKQRARRDTLFRQQRELWIRKGLLRCQIVDEWVPINGLCLCITALARRGLNHDAEERELLHLLGTHSVNAQAWPYVAAALKAREEPCELHFVTWIMARAELRGELGRAA